MHVFHSLSVSVEQGFVQRAYQLGALASTPVFIQINCCREIYPYHLKGAHCQADFLSHLESRHSCQCWRGPGAVQEAGDGGAISLQNATQDQPGVPFSACLEAN